ncbi:hypothetical protein SRHO_G00235700 [Serrasalmus rhombeus]
MGATSVANPVVHPCCLTQQMPPANPLVDAGVIPPGLGHILDTPRFENRGGGVERSSVIFSLRLPYYALWQVVKVLDTWWWRSKSRANICWLKGIGSNRDRRWQVNTL